MNQTMHHDLRACYRIVPGTARGNVPSGCPAASNDLPEHRARDAALSPEMIHRHRRCRIEKAKETTMNNAAQSLESPVILPCIHGGYCPHPTVMTEEALIRFLRIPDISSARNYRHVIENLKRAHGLPRIHLCGKTVYLTDAVRQWLQQNVTCSH